MPESACFSILRALSVAHRTLWSESKGRRLQTCVHGYLLSALSVAEAGAMHGTWRCYEYRHRGRFDLPSSGP